MTELAIPDPLHELVPQGWGLELLTELDKISDLEPLDNGRAELAGHVTAYRKKRLDVTELRIAERMVEIRMGELLGPAPPHGGDRSSIDQSLVGADLNSAQRSEFRALATHREQIILWIKGGTIGRAPLLARIAAKRAGYTMPDLAELPRCAVVYADPPWRYEHSVSDSREIENQYTTMTTAAILVPFDELRRATITNRERWEQAAEAGADGFRWVRAENERSDHSHYSTWSIAVPRAVIQQAILAAMVVTWHP